MTITMKKYGKAPLLVRMARNLRPRSGWVLVGYGPSKKVFSGCE